MPPRDTRQIGRTALRATTLGLGTATLGAQANRVSRQDGEAILRAAWDAGLRHFDTAPFYGAGAAERRSGDALRDRPRAEYVLSTKVGRLLRPLPHSAAPMPFAVEYDYSHDGILRSVDDSLQRLGLGRIDVLYVHDIGSYQHGAAEGARHLQALRDGGYRALDTLRRAGVVGAIGIGVNESQVLVDAMAFGDWDVFLLAGRYTLLEQAPLDDLLPLCLRRGTSIVIGGPLNSGILAGRDTWNYAAAPPEVVARVARLQAVCTAHDVPLPAAALQFPLAHPAVCSVIPGPRSTAELAANLEYFSRPIPAAFWAALQSAGLLHANAPVPA